MSAQLILEFHGIGSPHGGLADADEPMYWLSPETFASLLQAIVVNFVRDPIYPLRSPLTTATKAMP